MMDSTTSNGIAIGQLTPISVDKTAIRQADSAEIASFNREMKKMLEGTYTRPDGPSGYGDYAQVVLNGKVVATLDNSGAATLYGIAGGSSLDNNGSGPELAQRRAEQIAQATGGTIVTLSSAMTEAQWSSREPLRYKIDFDAMKRDGLYEQWQSLNASSGLSAQILAQNQED